MDKRAEMIALADRFFDALEKGDYETVESCYGPECVIWHSRDNLYEPRASNLAMLKRGLGSSTKRRLHDRRVMPFEGGFVQQHRIELEYPSGYVGSMDVCFIAHVVNDKISRFYEYFDRNQQQKLIEPK
jgi:ketosteroid isomerase-like protein